MLNGVVCHCSELGNSEFRAEIVLTAAEARAYPLLGCTLRWSSLGDPVVSMALFLEQ